MVFVMEDVQAARYFKALYTKPVGLYVGGQVFKSGASGVFGEDNTPVDFNLKKAVKFNYFIAFEHPFSLFPNVRISKVGVETSGETTSTQEFLSFEDGIFHIDVETEVAVDAVFNVNYVDYTLYYQLFDNSVILFDLGLTARDFNSAVTETETIITVTTSDDGGLDAEEHPEHGHIVTERTKTVITEQRGLTDTVPMLFIAANLNLPSTNFNVFAQGDFSFAGNYRFADFEVGLSYLLVNSKLGDFNLTLGYRFEKVTFKDVNNLPSDVDFSGGFVGLIAHF